MHPDTGQHALRATGLWPGFTALARPEGEQMRLVTRDCRILFDAAPPQDGQGNPEIDRGQLRDLLLGSLAPGTVRWGHKLERAEPLGDGRHRLHFAHGLSTETDLVVGADGAWSRVRRMLTGAVPNCTGVTFVETGLNDARHPAGRRRPPDVPLLRHGRQPRHARRRRPRPGPSPNTPPSTTPSPPYEKILIPRSVEAAEGAAEGIAGAFAPDSAEQTLAHMTAHH